MIISTRFNIPSIQYIWTYLCPWASEILSLDKFLWRNFFVGFQDPVIFQSLIYFIYIPPYCLSSRICAPLVAIPFVLVNKYLVLSCITHTIYFNILYLISQEGFKLPLATSNRLSSLHLNNNSFKWHIEIATSSVPLLSIQLL